MSDIKIHSENGRLSALETPKGFFTPVDIIYTLAQRHNRALLGENVHVNRHWPTGCMCFESGYMWDRVENTITERKAILRELQEGKYAFYADADGNFIFSGEAAPNLNRALHEFKQLYDVNTVIPGPSLTAFKCTVSALYHRRMLDGNTLVYMYLD